MDTEGLKPNILLVSFDDAVAFWRYKSAFGQALLTPNLDRVCRQSTAFHSGYCQSPVCGPSRASFMSGLAPHQTGVFQNEVSIFDKVPIERMWPHMLKTAGYFCSSGGKVHHGYKPLPKPVHEALYSDERKGFRIDKKLPARVSQKSYGGHGGGLATTDPADAGYYHDAHSSQSFTDFIQNYSGEAPFYREVGFYGPHAPFITPQPFKDLYPERGFKKPEAWADGFDENAFATENMPENMAPEDRRRWRRSVRNYFSAYSHADHHFGIVWDALQNSAHARNTIVVVLSDHGFHLGERNRFRKTTLWEQVAGVPLIIHDPTERRGREIHQPVALLDVGPTLLDYARLTPPDDWPGRSLRAVVEGQPAPNRAVPTFHYDSASVRYGRYRLIRYADASVSLFDLEEDWWQMRNLGRDHAAFADMYDTLVSCCLEYGLDLLDDNRQPAQRIERSELIRQGRMRAFSRKRRKDKQ